MKHSHVDKRSKRYVARQFVSEYELLPKEIEMVAETKLARIKGTVKFFDKEKGYGFVKRQGEKDVFFHGKSLERAGIAVPVTAGTELEFDLVPVEGKGGKAINIKLVIESQKS